MANEPRKYTNDELVALLPLPAPSAHKYSRGTATLVAGSVRYPGAARLAAVAAQRCGAGYTRVITEATNVAAIQAQHPSLVVRSWSDCSLSELAASTADRPCAYVVGCGFEPDNDPAARLTLSILERAEAPVLIDGGAFSAVASDKGCRLTQRRHLLGLQTVLTPHAGEATQLARAAGIAKALEVGEPAQLARSLARAYGALVVLKGVDTYVTDGVGTVLMDRGTAALAKAGTGDVLAGMIGAFLAQGMGASDAAVLGATLHADAGRIAAERYTEICVTPEDVIECIPHAIRALAACGETLAAAGGPRARHAL